MTKLYSWLINDIACCWLEKWRSWVIPRNPNFSTWNCWFSQCNQTISLPVFRRWILNGNDDWIVVAVNIFRRWIGWNYIAITRFLAPTGKSHYLVIISTSFHRDLLFVIKNSRNVNFLLEISLASTKFVFFSLHV